MFDRLVTIFLLASIGLGCVTWLRKERFADVRLIRPELMRQPVQTPTHEPPFTFTYRDVSYQAIPLARYELWGLVVSHNDIDSIADTMHDENSVDTKDVCVLWGRNLQRPDFNHLDIHNASFTCFFRYGPGVFFEPRDLSNNHLITDSDYLRDKISHLSVGDQVHFKGLLVSYQEPRWGGFWRTSSLVRTDTGNGACEVVFVKDIEVYDVPYSLWHRLFLAAWIGAALLAVLKFFLALRA